MTLTLPSRINALLDADATARRERLPTGLPAALRRDARLAYTLACYDMAAHLQAAADLIENMEQKA